MSWFYVLVLTGFAVVLGLSQIVLKKAVVSAFEKAHAMIGVPLVLFQSAYFWTAILLYLLLAVVWVWLLTVVPVSKAYPFVVLSFVVVAILERLANQPVALNMFLGFGLILSGLLLVSKQ